MPRGMVLTDLDGTFLNSSGRISPENLAMLHRLGENDVVRVAAHRPPCILHARCQT